MSMVPITLLYAGCFALLAVLLANYVLYIRLRARSLPDWQPKAAERVQANFVENVPMALLLMLLVELSGAATGFLHAIGLALVLCRVLHAYGLARYPGANYPRYIGAQGTFVIMAVLGFAAVLLALVPQQAAADERCEPGEAQVFWGDLHIHSRYSMDAYVWDNQVSPTEAYQFAQGASQTLLDGTETKIDRPLDFAAVTDHGEYFGVIEQCQNAEVETEYCRALIEVSKEISPRGFYELFLPALLSGDRLCQREPCAQDEENLWQRVVAAADEANKPCQFTAFIANEWTASPDNLHWHRNLIYANSNVPDRAINSFDEPSQEDMWRALADRCEAPCEVLAIPHNGNIGMGGAFNIEGHNASLMSLRAKFEKLVEIHQHKGSSECYSGSQFSDEACNFEIMLPVPILNAMRQAAEKGERYELSEADHASVSSGYVRDTLLRGLAAKSEFGVNPFQYGFIGSTDTHSGRPGYVAEQGWAGAIGSYDQDSERRGTYTHYNPGGLVAVWAEANTREHLFDAMSRRETYATSGPRIRLRFDVVEGEVNGCTGEMDPKAQPMGSVFSGEGSPTFVVQAEMDSVPLSDLDIIKLSYPDGKMQQSLKQWRADKGKRSWCQQWTDTDYQPGDVVAWYVRVREQPTERWDKLKRIQERAWSSPIWSSAAANKKRG